MLGGTPGGECRATSTTSRAAASGCRPLRAGGRPVARDHHRGRGRRRGAGGAGLRVRADGGELLESLQRSRDIGGFHGEGFVQYTSRGALHLDVELLNDKLRSSGKQRIRQAMRPDEAHGAILAFDGVIADTRALRRRAWQRVAEARGLPRPDLARGQIFALRPERAVTEVLQWTRDWKEAQAIAFDIAQAFTEGLEGLRDPQPGARAWLHALSKVHVPCAIVTRLDRRGFGEFCGLTHSCVHLSPSAACLQPLEDLPHAVEEDDDRRTLRAALERMGLADFFTALVTAEDDMDSIALSFLSAAVKLGRPPNRCVVFESSPDGITAGHNCSMKAVAVQTTHPAWQLKHADLAVGRLSELSVINVRRLFANVGWEWMDEQQQQAPGQPRLRRTRNGVAE